MVLKPNFLNNEINFVLEQLDYLIIKEKHQIKIASLPKAKIKKEHFACLAQNLISNAMKYSHPERESVINFNYVDRGFEHLFSVEDNGLGIEEKYFDQIFELFQRLHNSSEYSGNGIGLSLCKRITEIYHGKIWLESTYGQGSKFYFSIPKEPSL